MMRGYCGIGCYSVSNGLNAGGVFRSAHGFRCQFIFTIGANYKKQKADISKSWRHLPLWSFKDWEDFKHHRPRDAKIIAVENTTFDLRRHEITNYIHSERAIYIVGSELGGIPYSVLKDCDDIIYIDTAICLNLASAATAVLLHRHCQRG
jgi:tRNA G18 (ribose-2'-O)-methylase SpoU